MPFRRSAIGAAYASQGRAVARVARQQRRKREPAPAPRRPPAPKRYTPPASMRSDAASGGRRQMERAERFKGTRRYYRDYQAGFRANPKVKAASATIGAGTRKAYPRVNRKPVKPTFAQKQAGMALILKGQQAYERESRRGPDRIATPIYDRYTKQLWERAKRYYDEPGKQPRMVVDYDPKLTKAANAWVMSDDRNTVHVAPKMVREFMLPKQSRRHSESVPLHEWVHTRQPKALFVRSNEARREGEAEATERLLARRLGLRYEIGTPKYERWARQAAPSVARRYGAPQVTTAQIAARRRRRRRRPVKIREYGKL